MSLTRGTASRYGSFVLRSQWESDSADRDWFPSGILLLRKGKSMSSTRKGPAIAAAVSLAGLAAGLLVITPGVANAQTNSRLCGRYLQSKGTKEVIVKLVEVQKNDFTTCDPAAFGNWNIHEFEDFENLILGDTTGNVATNPQQLTERDWKEEAWTLKTFKYEVCEERNGNGKGWKKRAVDNGGLGGRGLAFQGKTERWPAKQDQEDICNNMNRQDSQAGPEPLRWYWLYYDGKSDTVNFYRDPSNT